MSEPVFVPPGANAEPPTLGEHNGFAIYPMPLFATLECADLERSRAWYLALGFGDVFSFRAPDGSLTMTHLRRRKYQDLMLVPRAVPAEGGAPTLRLVLGAEGEVSSLFDRARGAAAVGRSAVAEPQVTPWNTRDLHVTDPDGHQVVFSERHHDEAAHQAWAERFADDRKGR